MESNRGNISKFCITKATLNPGKNYIRAHTCFNRLDIPDFKTFKELEDALTYIVKNEILGFGIDWNLLLNNYSIFYILWLRIKIIMYV